MKRNPSNVYCPRLMGFAGAQPILRAKGRPHDSDHPDISPPVRGAGGRRRGGAAPQYRVVDPPGRRRHLAGPYSRPAAHCAGAGTGAARHSAAADLFGRRRHELARIPFQSAPHHPARLRLHSLHRLGGGGGIALSARHAVGSRLRARRHRGADRRGGAARDCAPARIAAPADRRARGRGAGQ